MTFAWKTAGLTYNRYLAVAARTVRRSLKPEIRAKVDRNIESDLKFAKWENGKQGDLKSLTQQNAEAMAEAAASASK
ncbi:hypothetical protein VTO42DRAFT_525 [Malbranchea cinnamomea]